MKVAFFIFSFIFSVNLANASEPLTIAVENGDVDRVKELIANGYKVNERDHSLSGSTVLILAVQDNNLEMVKILLEAGMYPNDYASFGPALVHALREVLDAITEKRYEDSGSEELIVKKLLEHGAEVSLTLLKEVSRLGLPKTTVGNLLKYVDAKEKDGNTALIEASTYEVVVEAGANPNAVNKHGVTLLINALKNGHYKKAKKLIELGANVNAIDQNGKTAFIYAIENLHYYGSEIIETLISAGANVNAIDQNGKTALIYLIKQIDRYYNSGSEQAIKTIEMLFKNGAELDAKDKDANTRLLLFVLRNKYFEPVEKLIALGADVNASIAGMTPLMYASKYGNVNAVEKLIKAGADVDAALDNFGGRRTMALDEALKAGHLEVVRRLIKANSLNFLNISVDTDAVDNLALALFSYSGNAKAIGKLIALGANVNFSTPYYGITPLMYASGSENVEAVKKLIKAGADVNVKDKDGKTAFHRAFINKRLAVVEALLKAGAVVDVVKLNKALFKAGAVVDVKLTEVLQQLLKDNNRKTTKHVGSQQAGKALAGKCEGSFSNR